MQTVRASFKGHSLHERPENQRLALIVHVISLVGGFVLLLWLNRDQWFFADEWDFLTDRGFEPGDAGLFEPHGEHWSTIPVLLFRGLFSVFGIRTYLPYITVLLILHVVVAHLLWRVMRGSGVAPWIATGLAGMFLVFGGGYENLLWAFQIGFVGSVMCGLGQILLVDHTGSFGRRDVAGWGLSILGLMFSGVGVPMTATAGVVALIRRGWRALLITVAPAAAVFVVWLVTVGRAGLASHPPTVEAVLRLPLYVMVGIRETIERIAGVEGIGIQLFVPLVFLLGVIGLLRGRSVTAAPMAGVAGSIAMFGVTGIGRLALYGGRLLQAGSPRYVYVVAALLLPLIALGLTTVARTSPPARIAVLVFIILGVITSFRVLQEHAEGEGRRKQLIRNTVLAAAVPSSFQGPMLGTTPLPRDTNLFSPGLQLDELVAMRLDGDLPPIEAIPEEARLQAAANLQVSLSAEPQLTSNDRSAVLVGGPTSSIEGGCVSFDPSTSLQRPTAVIAVSEQASVGIRPAASGRIEVLIRRGQTISPFPRTFGLSAGRTSFLNIAVPGSEVIVRLPPAGLTTVCNLREP